MSLFKSITLLLTFTILSISAVTAQSPQKAENISPLLIGEKIPDAELIDAAGDAVTLKSQIQSKHTVLVFYRGNWCPYCNLQLAGLADIEDAIIKLGYQIIAISPDDFKNIDNAIEKSSLHYSVYSDPKGKLIKQMGIAFNIKADTKGDISEKTLGKTTNVLPVPAVFIVNSEGNIEYEYIGLDYKKRISPELLIAVLENLDSE